MRRLATVAVGAALGCLLLSLAPAEAASTAGLTVDDGVMFSGCRDRTFAFSFPVGSDETWQADVKLIDPSGKVVGDQVITDPSASGTGSVQICNDWLVGTYHLQAHVTAENWAGYSFDEGTYSASFSMRLPETTTYMTAARKGKHIIIRTLTWDERTSDWYVTPSAAVRIQHKVHGHWKSLKGRALVTNRNGRAKYVFKSKKRQSVRAVTLPSYTNYTGSASSQAVVKRLHLKD